MSRAVQYDLFEDSLGVLNSESEKRKKKETFEQLNKMELLIDELNQLSEDDPEHTSKRIL